MSPFRAAVVVLSLGFPSTVIAAPTGGFDGLRCGADVAQALVGRSSPEGRVPEIEKRYAALGLKDLGGTEWTEQIFLASWRICGVEYVFLEEKQGKRWTIRDVLSIPAHSPERPQFAGTCREPGRAWPQLWAIVENRPGVELLPAIAAWRIDSKSKKFVAVQTRGLTCPRDGIATEDGGN
jgi:hypothetical protein